MPSNLQRGERRVMVAASLVSAVGWSVIFVDMHDVILPGNCLTDAIDVATVAMRWKLAMTLNLPVNFALATFAMIAAMMTPVLIEPLRHIRGTVLRRRRTGAMLTFIMAYGMVWLGAEIVIQLAGLFWRVVIPGRAGQTLGSVAIAVAWQSSPAKQFCLNRCHRIPPISPFSMRAERDALRYGLRYAWWCVGSCWAFMLLPLVSATGHMPTMIAVMAWIWGERLERARPPTWQWRWPRKACCRVAFWAGNIRGLQPYRGRNRKKLACD